jgi:hypothetical protein
VVVAVFGVGAAAARPRHEALGDQVADLTRGGAGESCKFANVHRACFRHDLCRKQARVKPFYITFVKTAMRSCYFSDFKEMVACAGSAALSAIQDNSDLPQGLKPTIGGTVAREGSRQIKSPATPVWLDNMEMAMNMSVTQFTAAPAMVGRNRSLWRQTIDMVIEGPPRTAAGQIAEYLARHQYDLSPALRIELERRHVCV